METNSQVAAAFSRGDYAANSRNMYSLINRLYSFKTVIALRYKEKDGSYFFLVDNSSMSNSTRKHQTEALYYTKGLNRVVLAFHGSLKTVEFCNTTENVVKEILENFFKYVKWQLSDHYEWYDEDARPSIKRSCTLRTENGLYTIDDFGYDIPIFVREIRKMQCIDWHFNGYNVDITRFFDKKNALHNAFAQYLETGIFSLQDVVDAIFGKDTYAAYYARTLRQRKALCTRNKVEFIPLEIPAEIMVRAKKDVKRHQEDIRSKRA